MPSLCRAFYLFLLASYLVAILFGNETCLEY